MTSCFSMITKCWCSCDVSKTAFWKVALESCLPSGNQTWHAGKSMNKSHQIPYQWRILVILAMKITFFSMVQWSNGPSSSMPHWFRGFRKPTWDGLNSSNASKMAAPLRFWAGFGTGFQEIFRRWTGLPQWTGHRWFEEISHLTILD